MLKGKTILIGVTGSIAAYKMADCARALTKMHADVHVLMTKNATSFINPITFETLTNHKCLIDTFDRNFQYSVEHVSLAKAADAVLIAPASANVIGRIANGIADDMLTTTVMACTCKKLIAPAMNHNMLHNPIVRDNIKRLEQYGYEIISPEHGMLANGDYGDGRLPDVDVLIDYVLREVAKPKDMAGLRALVTAGATAEPIDPVRYITNHSSGRMGIELARAASLRGANVTLVAGKCTVPLPPFVDVINVTTAQDMYNEVTRLAPECDIIVKAAAVADFTPTHTAEQKIKKSGEDEMTLRLMRTKDILLSLGQSKREGQLICGFSMETQDLEASSRKKLEAKGCDMICANSLTTQGAGFGVDTNILTLITHEGSEQLEKMSKAQAADVIFDRLLKMRKNDETN